MDLLTSYGEAEELSGKVAELEAALKVARDALEFYSDPHVAGQPAAGDWKGYAKQGISTEVNLRLPGELLGPAQGPAHRHACLRALALLPHAVD